MQDRRSRTTVAALVGAAFILGAVLGGVLQGANADSRGAPATCSKAGLAGAFGVTFDGRSENLGLFRSVSRFKFDGEGGFRAIEFFSSEETGPKRRSITGGYRIDDTCVFSLLFPSELGRAHDVFGRCVLMADGREFSCLDAEEGWVATGAGVKI